MYRKWATRSKANIWVILSKWQQCTQSLIIYYSVMFLSNVFQFVVYTLKHQHNQCQVQFSSRWYLWAQKAHIHSIPSLRSFPNTAFETVPMFIWLWWPFLVLSGKIIKCLLFPHLLQAINGVVSLALCPQVVAPQHFRSSETQATCDGCFACLCICSVISLQSPMAWTQGVFESGCWPLTHCSLGFPFHFSLFVAGSMNPSGWWHVWSDCHLLRQSSRRHGWLVPPPLSRCTVCMDGGCMLCCQGCRLLFNMPNI